MTLEYAFPSGSGWIARTVRVLLSVVWSVAGISPPIALAASNGRVSGTVVSERGDPVRAARVWLVKPKRGHEPIAVTTDPQGRFEFRDIGPGGFRLAVVAGDKSYGGRTFTRGEDELVDETNVRLTVIPAAALRLRVIDEQSQPIEGVEVDGIALRQESNNWFWFPLDRIPDIAPSSLSEGDGELTVEHLPSPGSVRLRLMASQHEGSRAAHRADRSPRARLRGLDRPAGPFGGDARQGGAARFLGHLVWSVRA